MTISCILCSKKSLEEIRQEELQPFIKAVKARVDFVMMAHIIVDDIDPEFPCSLSEKAHEMLRSELKFKGLILSDDMQMKAVTDNFGGAEAAVLAIKAGSDMIEYRDFNEAVIGYEGLQKAAKDKVIKGNDILEKVARVNEMKKKYLSEYKPIYIPDLEKKINRRSSQVFVDDVKKKILEKKSREQIG